MVALLESSPQRVRGAIRMTVKAHQKRFPNRWRPQSQRPSSQMRSLLIGCEPGGLLSAKPVSVKDDLYRRRSGPCKGRITGYLCSDALPF